MSQLGERLDIMCRWLLVIVVGLASNVWAHDAVSPREQVIETSRQMLAVLDAQRDVLRKDPLLIYDYVDEILLPHFDFERMAKWVLGKYWRRASPDQRQRFIAEFRHLLVRTYASALLDYTDQELVYLPLPMRKDDSEVTVRTEIRPKRGVPIPVNYSMYKASKDWKVYDVTIDHVSLVSNYRSSFANEIRRSGIDGLIGKLAERNAPSKS